MGRADARRPPIETRRWFRAKGRPIAGVDDIDRAAISPAELVVVEVRFADGGVQRYLDLRVDGREPVDGDGAWLALADLIGSHRELRASAGSFVANRTAAFENIRGTGQAERRLRVEQSNTSAIVGDGAILKLFRLLEPGLNPDLEIGAFLTDADFGTTPSLGGYVLWQPDEGEASAAAMLQAFVPSRGDAWAAMLDALRHDPEEAAGMAADIGRLTAELHRALASKPSEAFPARAATVDEAASWRAGAERQLALATDAVTGPEHEELVRLGPGLRARFADAFGAASGQTAVTRIHGDLHLGQVLARTDGGWSVIDFEGEPARPLAERRAPTSPLRDVAGMLRSLDYAARTAERDGHLDAESWLPGARSAFLDGYGDIGLGDLALLTAFELEKACYEVRYEAGNRPEWLWLPLAALRRLAEG